MAFNVLSSEAEVLIVNALSPRFVGRDQDHLLALADVAAEAGFDRAYDYIEPLTDRVDDLEGYVATEGPLRADLALSSAGKGASLVGFLQSGTGAIPRTLYNRELEQVSVKDFGAIGDGVANDTAAIQAAVTATAGGSLYFPKGHYKTTAVVTLPDAGITLIGDGPFASIIQPRTNDQVVFSKINTVLAYADISIRSLGISAGDTTTGVLGIAFTLCSNTDISDVVFSGLRRNFEIDRGYTHAITKCVSRGTNGLQAGNFALWSSVDTDYIFHVNVRGYMIRNAGNGVNGPACYIRRGVGCNIDGLQCNDASTGGPVTLVKFENDCQGCKLVNGITSAANYGVEFATGTGVAIAPSFCTVQNFDFDGPVADCIRVTNGNWITISGCNFTSYSASTGYGINVYDANKININGNVFNGFKGSERAALVIEAAATYVQFSNNIVDDCYAGVWFGTANNVGSRVYGNVFTTSVTNTIYGSFPLSAAKISISGTGSAYGGTTPAMPASTVGVTNTEGFAMRVFITGGTVTQVTIRGQITGVTTPASLILYPDESIAIAYSVAPTWKWIAIT